MEPRKLLQGVISCADPAGDCASSSAARASQQFDQQPQHFRLVFRHENRLAPAGRRAAFRRRGPIGEPGRAGQQVPPLAARGSPALAAEQLPIERDQGFAYLISRSTSSCGNPQRFIRTFAGESTMSIAIRRVFWIALALLATLAVASPASAAATAKEAAAPDIEVLSATSKAMSAVIKRVLPAVVHVNVVTTVEQPQSDTPDIFNDPFFRRFFGPNMPQQPEQPRQFQQKGLGSGFIVSADGYIVTNNHVAGNADKITVKLRDGREFDAKRIGADAGTDLAVIKIDAKDLPTVQFGDSRQLEVGETVIAVGNPFGLEQTVTEGIVSAKGRSELGLSEYEDFIQTDASINPGNSGGPLIDVTGKVVGVNTAIFSRSGGSMGIGFAIPSNLAQHIMTALIKDGAVHRGFLGVSIQDLTPELAKAMGIQENTGVLISDVQADTPAAKAGLRQGDVVVSFADQPVRTANDLRVRVANVDPGSTVPLTVLRDGARIAVRVSLSERPSEAAAGKSQEQGGGQAPAGAPERQLGMALEPLSPDIAQQLGYRGLQGVLVSAVESGSVADEAGLQRGALILQVNRHPVSTVEAFRKAVRAAKPGSRVLLLVRMGEGTRFVALEMPKK
jgi:serine protease Do